jgi:molybdopterin-binding protein
VLNDGQIVQVGTAEEILRQPSSEFVARFALSRNVFAGEAEEAEDGCAFIDIGGIKIMATTELCGKVHLSLRPEDILISKEPLQSTARNSFQGIISQVADRGGVIYVTVSLPSEPLDFICLITRQAFEELGLRKGMKVWLSFKASAIHVF